MNVPGDSLCTVTWRMSGSLRSVFRQFDDITRESTLRTIGAKIEEDARANLAAKGWRRLAFAIQGTLNTQIRGQTITVGAWHAAAGMRHRGGRIAAPGQGPAAIPARALTIPLSGSPAVGKTTRQMKAQGWKLFRPKGTRVLMGTHGKGTEPVALFALAKAVQHPASPWFPSLRQIRTRVAEVIQGTA